MLNLAVAEIYVIGVRTAHHREVLGAPVRLSEHEGHWREFLGSLKGRRLHGVKLFISDAH
ncbi:hypothetical protein JCM39068_43090 [Desulfocastanea catecholica]